MSARVAWIILAVVVLSGIAWELWRRREYLRGWESAKRGDPVGADFFTNSALFRLGSYEGKGNAPKQY